MRALRQALAVAEGEKEVSLGLLSMMETGNRPQTHEIAFRLARVLSIDVELAISTAHQARVEHCVDRERASREAFLESKKALRKLDPATVAQSLKW